MTIRCRSKLSALLLFLPLGLCSASTSLAASDDDDEEWHDTKGPRSERASSEKRDTDDSDQKAAKKSSDDASAKDASAKGDEKGADDGGAERGKKKEFKASSDAPPADSKLSLAVLGSYGVADAQGPGLGVRGGANVYGAIPLYFGGVVEYFFGTTVEEKNFHEPSTQKWQLTYLGGEAGVNLAATTDLTVRPYFGLGIALDKSRHCSGDNACSGDTKGRLTIDPGIVGLYRLGDFFVGPDLRYLIVPGGGTASGVVFSATVGMNL